MTDTMTVSEFRIKMAERDKWTDIKQYGYGGIVGIPPTMKGAGHHAETPIPDPYHRIDHAFEAAKGLPVHWSMGSEDNGLGPFWAEVGEWDAYGAEPERALSRALCLYRFGKELVA